MLHMYFSPSHSLAEMHKRTSSRRTVVDGNARLAHSSSAVNSKNDLAVLNGHLEILCELYPEHAVSVVKENLLRISAESRLEVVANMIADLSDGIEKRPYATPVEPWQHFRAESYKDAVVRRLRSEFGKLSTSTIGAVLAENNHDYVRSRGSLLNIAGKSWRVSFLKFISKTFSRTSPSENQILLETGCYELDNEIDIVLHRDDRLRQLVSDAALARSLNEEYCRDSGDLFECQCCFGDYAWEDIAFCPALHYFCRNCLKRSVEESLNGQGSILHHEMNSIRCISSSAGSSCSASLSPGLLRHFLPSETMDALDDRFRKAALDSLDIRIVNCPFCPYAVIDDAPSGVSFLAWLFTWGTLVGLTSLFRIPREVRVELDKAKRRPPSSCMIFRCENPSCKRSSCRECKQEWIGIHRCYEEGINNKAVYVARRIDEVVKRTCPQCHLSFVKTDGCNKMVCKCGYKMCYLCRQDLSKEGYKHFCPHFRAVPGTPCIECTKCSLYQAEAEGDVIRATRRQAEIEWEGRAGDKITFTSQTHEKPGSQLKGWHATVFELCMAFR